FPMLKWSARTWQYTRDFAFNMGWGFYVPVWMLGALGHRGWRWSVALAVGATGSLVIALATPEQEVLAPALGFLGLVVAWSLLDQREAGPRAFVGVGLGTIAVVGAAVGLQFAELLPAIPVPEFLTTAPPYVLISLGLVTFALSFSDERVPARPLLLSLCLAAVCFAVIAQWDWMKGYRWYAPAVVPGAMLFAFGLHHLAVQIAERVTTAEGRPSRMVVALGIAGLAVGLAIPPNVVETIDRVRNADASPKGVRRRANYVMQVRDRLHLEERLRDLEVDMGGHMYWTDFEMVDIAGLVDVPMGHHKFQGAFVDEYIFEEQRPHFVHLHDAWERNSRIKRRPAWRNRMYLEIAPYPSGKTRLHGGNHVRRDIVLPERWAHGDELVELEKGARVHGVHVPSEPPVGGKVYLEVGVSQQDVRGQDDFGMWLTARNGEHVQRWDLAPGYGWVGATEWRQDEVFHGKYSLDVPKTLPPGRYALTLTIVGAKGEVRRVEATGEPEVAVGTLTLLAEADALAAAEDDREAAGASAEALRCTEAEQRWFLARKHQVADPDWREQHRDATKRALAECWAKKAADVDRDTKVDHLVRAREHDHWAPTYRRAARALAQELYDEGLVAREQENWEAAYRLFSDAVAVDRSRSWARRYAEEARAERLGLGPRKEKTAKR
ncbi:MAG: DMT family transporter, partial [Myxococcota bacterium]